MHENLKSFWKRYDKDYLLQPMTAWFDAFDTRRPEPEGVKGFIFENHLGLANVRALVAGYGLYVYAMRHGDDWCEPADVENREVVVNFYAYFITDRPLDDLFTEERDWHEVFDWTMDWDGEEYWN